MRFTLAASLALMAFFAVLCFLLTTQPSVAAYFLLITITILAPVCAVAGIVYGRDNLRAFCIGTALPLALLVWSSSQELREISFDPAAYGWAKQGQQEDADALAYRNLVRVFVTANGQTSGGGAVPATGINSNAGLQGAISLARSGAHAQTLERVQAMTGPTCSLCIAAVVCGVLVMAIRGGLQRKETAPNQSSSTIST
jgi:hypothetical protein